MWPWTRYSLEDTVKGAVLLPPGGLNTSDFSFAFKSCIVECKIKKHIILPELLTAAFSTLCMYLRSDFRKNL